MLAKLKRIWWLKLRVITNVVEIIFIVWMTSGYIASLFHQCPLPSVPHVQRTLNKNGSNLEVDGVAGPKTVTDWMMISPTWEAQNERKLIKEAR